MVPAQRKDPLSVPGKFFPRQGDSFFLAGKRVHSVAPSRRAEAGLDHRSSRAGWGLDWVRSVEERCEYQERPDSSPGALPLAEAILQAGKFPGVEERMLWQFPVHSRVPEPLVHGERKAHLGAVPETLGKRRLGGFSEHPLGGSRLAQMGGDAEEFPEENVIDQGCPDFEGVAHAHCVGVAKELHLQVLLGLHVGRLLLQGHFSGPYSLFEFLDGVGGVADRAEVGVQHFAGFVRRENSPNGEIRAGKTVSVFERSTKAVQPRTIAQQAQALDAQPAQATRSGDGAESSVSCLNPVQVSEGRVATE